VRACFDCPPREGLLRGIPWEDVLTIDLLTPSLFSSSDSREGFFGGCPAPDTAPTAGFAQMLVHKLWSRGLGITVFANKVPFPAFGACRLTAASEGEDSKIPPLGRESAPRPPCTNPGDLLNFFRVVKRFSQSEAVPPGRGPPPTTRFF